MKKSLKTLSLILVGTMSGSLVGCELPFGLGSIDFPWESHASETPTPSVSVSDSQSETKTDTQSETKTETPTETPTESQTQTISVTESESVTQEIVVDMNYKFPQFENSGATVETMHALGAYTPETFNASSFSKSKYKTLADGAILYECGFTTNSRNVKVFTIEVDLTKVTIAAGSYNNTYGDNYTALSVPVDQAAAWERDNPGRKVLSTINADFFGNACCNAFVKDGVILKAAHNNTPDDIPVSAPMLFGVSSAGAKIAPMTNTGNRLYNYTTALTYGNQIEFYGKDKEVSATLSGGYADTAVTSKSTYTICAKKGNYRFVKGYVYRMKIIDNKNSILHGCIIDKQYISAGKQFTVLDDGYGYISVGDYVKTELEVGTYFTSASYVTSPRGGNWDHFDTIIGARHSLIEDGKLPATLYEEKNQVNNNGVGVYAPRSAVGIKPDGTVVIVCVEDLHYGGKATTCTGCTAVQLADFMRYYGCYDAANFDGGGSSQLCVKSATESQFAVAIRSSDTGSYTPNSSRKVLNTLMVVTK